MCHASQPLYGERNPCVWIVENLDFVRPVFFVVVGCHISKKCFSNGRVWVWIKLHSGAHVLMFWSGEACNDAHTIKFCQSARIRKHNGRDVLSAREIKEA